MPGRSLVLDANILIRAVLGVRVRRVIEMYVDKVSFFVPESAYVEAEEYVGELVARRGGDPEKALVYLRSLSQLVKLIGPETYGEFEAKRGKGSAPAIRTTGRFWRQLWRLAAQSGPKIPTCSVAA